jgi:hypothetical protein
MIRLSMILSRWLALWLALAAPVGGLALEVRETIWGFDGKVVPGRFNPLSVLVENPGNSVFDGQFLLSPTDGAGNRRGADYVQPAYLAPHTARWLQFHVFFGNNVGNHVLIWGRDSTSRYDLTPIPNFGPPACVWLRNTDSIFSRVGAMKAFPAELFPTTLTATDGLDAVVLDHAPNWEPARREAFRQWIERGGTVHLLRTASGQYPQFSDDLAGLNSTVDQLRLGSGRVVWHAIATREMSEQYLAEHGFPARTLQQTKEPTIYDLEPILFRQLASLTRPDVNWAAIHLLALAYIGVIGPLHFHYRRRLDYRVSIAAFLITVALFSTALAIVGRRGYGETQTVHSLAVARALGGGRCDVTQWISAFATDGDLYTLTHTAPANLYATEQSADSGGGRILNGKDGRILLDIPLYSSRAFIHRAVMPGADPEVHVEKWETNASGSLRALRLVPGSGFPKDASQVSARVGDMVCDLAFHDGGWELQHPVPLTLKDYFSGEKIRPHSYGQGFGKNEGPDAHCTLMPLLAAQVLNAPEIFQQTVSEPANRADLQLLVVAPAPASFRLQGRGFDRERGWVLYVQDVFKP